MPSPEKISGERGAPLELKVGFHVIIKHIGGKNTFIYRNYGGESYEIEGLLFL